MVETGLLQDQARPTAHRFPKTLSTLGWTRGCPEHLGIDPQSQVLVVKDWLTQKPKGLRSAQAVQQGKMVC